MPGATFTHGVAGRAASRRTTTAASSRRRRRCGPAPVRRAGSANATSKPAWSSVVASATCTAPRRPSAARLASATATRTGSRSTPAAVRPARGERDQVAADPAAEVDHRRRRRTPRSRAARCVGDRQPGGLLEAVGGEVHPGRVGRRTSPRPARRSSTWVSAAADVRRRRAPYAAAPSCAASGSSAVADERDRRAPAAAARRRSAATGRRRGPRRRSSSADRRTSGTPLRASASF